MCYFRGSLSVLGMRVPTWIFLGIPTVLLFYIKNKTKHIDSGCYIETFPRQSATKGNLQGWFVVVVNVIIMTVDANDSNGGLLL